MNHKFTFLKPMCILYILFNKYVEDIKEYYCYRHSFFELPILKIISGYDQRHFIFKNK